MRYLLQTTFHVKHAVLLDEITALFDRQAAGYDTQWARTAPVRDCMYLVLESLFAGLPADARILCVGAGTGAVLPGGADPCVGVATGSERRRTRPGRLTNPRVPAGSWSRPAARRAVAGPILYAAAVHPGILP